MAVLVTTDGSERSLQILPHAAALARATGRPLELLRVLDRRIDLADEVATTVAEATERVSARWRDELAAALEAAGIEGTPLVEPRNRAEEADRAILRVAKARGAEALAMHSRGTGALRHALLGSITMGVIGRAPLPVLVTGPQAASTPAGGTYRVAITSDGSDAACRAVEAVAPIFDGTGVPVTLIGIAVPGGKDAFASLDDSRAHLAELRERLPVDLDVELRPGEPENGEPVHEAIIRVAVAAGASAIASSTHGHSARYRLFSGSVAMGMLGVSPLPLLLVSARPRP